MWVRDDPEAFLLHPSLYESVKAAWMRGEAFFTGHDTYGDELVIKLGNVTTISHATPENMALAEADAKADKLKADIDG